MRNEKFVLEVKNNYTYTYIVKSKDTNDAVIIDPAWDYKKLINLLDYHYLNLTGILVTHHHDDHTNAIEALLEYYDVPVIMDEAEISYYNVKLPNLCPVYIDGVISTLGNNDIVYLSTPGHTKGSACFKINNNIFTGDTLFTDGCGSCFFDGGNAYQMFNSLKKISQNINDDTTIYPGHRFSSEIGKKYKVVKKENIYLNIKEINQFVKFRMRENQENLFAFT